MLKAVTETTYTNRHVATLRPTTRPPCSRLGLPPLTRASRILDFQELYNNETRQIQQQLHLHQKWPREEWDSAMWEIPLRPLPKRHKVCSGPNELEVHQ